MTCGITRKIVKEYLVLLPFYKISELQFLRQYLELLVQFWLVSRIKDKA